ncbi:MAG: DUF3791 domain-containing protein [Oscillospiraceae bacterium]|nr:DUF3791 domain-containing protein [Oscillospiraceae bacterium]
MSWDKKDITDMQCHVFRMAQKKWKVSPKQCADIFEKCDILGFIEECYDSLHLRSYKAALNDVEIILRNEGIEL